MNNLGFFYNTGYGCTENKAEGRKWIEKSAKLLNLSACCTLAHIYHDESETNPPVLHDCYTQLKICADKNYNDTQQLMADWFGPVKEEEWKGMSTIDMSNRGYDWMTGGNGFTKNLELAECRNTYVLDGTPRVLKPHFTFQGYRYIRIDKIFIWKNIKKCITHKTLRIYLNAIFCAIIDTNIAFWYIRSVL